MYTIFSVRKICVTSSSIMASSKDLILALASKGKLQPFDFDSLTREDFDKYPKLTQEMKFTAYKMCLCFFFIFVSTVMMWSDLRTSVPLLLYTLILGITMPVLYLIKYSMVFLTGFFALKMLTIQNQEVVIKNWES